MDTKREPLAVKNVSSGIPKPSRLLQPGSVTSLVNRKRPVLDTETTKENEPAVKRFKVEPTKSAPPITTTNSTKSATTAKPKTRSTTISAVTKKPSKTTSISSKVASKPKSTGNSTNLAAKKPTGSTKSASNVVAKSGTGTGKAGSGGKPKRAAWDLKGRLQDMEAMMADERNFSSNTIGDLQSQLVGLAQRLEELEGVRQLQEGTIIAKQEENTAASTQIKALESELTSTKKELQESTMKYEHELEMLRLSKSSLQRSVEQLESELKVSRLEAASLKEVVARMTADASAIQCQLDATRVARDQAQEDSAKKSREIDRLEGEVAAHLQTISDCKGRIREDEMVRRRLHNTIQELKGNIRVFCRVRPFLPSETDGCGRESISSNSSRGSGKGTSKVTSTPPAQLQINFPDEDFDGKKISLQYSSEQSSSSKSYEFDFDRVFGPQSTQEVVFEEISQLVQSVLDGYNVCIFAYGQTGSGKTYTMEGPEDPLPGPAGMDKEGMVVDRRGMISRAVEQVFSSAVQMRETGWEYKMSSSFLEIYNETIRDLLSSSASSSSGNCVPSHEIKIDPDRPGQVYVTNLTPLPVTSEKQVENLLERASKNRAVAATLCNERSSRSHSVFVLKVSGNNQKTGQKCEGILNLIDLAGSERLSQSGSQGERLRETKNINKSLSNLGNVIMALANKDSHVPYRNSKLTYLLQNSLGGNSKTLMFVNMSPLPESLQETLCSLRFATKVNQCNIGTAKKTVK